MEVCPDEMSQISAKSAGFERDALISLNGEDYRITNGNK
jgi:hypothetical protein